MKQRGSDRPKPRDPTLLGLPAADAEADARPATGSTRKPPAPPTDEDDKRTSGYRPPPPSSFPPPQRAAGVDSDEEDLRNTPIPPRRELSRELRAQDLGDLDDLDFEADMPTVARDLTWDANAVEEADELEDVPTSMNVDDSMLLPGPASSPPPAKKATLVGQPVVDPRAVPKPSEPAPPVRRPNPTLVGTGPAKPVTARPAPPRNEPKSGLEELDAVVQKAKPAKRADRGDSSSADDLRALATSQPALVRPSAPEPAPIPAPAPVPRQPAVIAPRPSESAAPVAAAPAPVAAPASSGSKTGIITLVASLAFLAGVGLAGGLVFWVLNRTPVVATVPETPAPSTTTPTTTPPPEERVEVAPQVAEGNTPPTEVAPPPTEALPSDPSVEADHEAAQAAALAAEREAHANDPPATTPREERHRGTSKAEATPSSFDAIREEARVHFQEHRWREAAAAYERAVAANPRHAGSWAGLGAARSQLGDYAGAIEAYRHAVEIQPDHSGFHAAAGRVFLQSGDRARAVVAYRRALALNPENAAARAALETLGVTP